MKFLGLMMQMRERMDRLRDGGWMVDGSGGWRVDSRSPKNIKSRAKQEKVKQKVICRANEDDVGDQKKEENKGSTMNQQSR